MDKEIKEHEIIMGKIFETDYELVIRKTIKGTIAEKVKITFRSLEPEKLFEIIFRNEAKFDKCLNIIFKDGFSDTTKATDTYGWFGKTGPIRREEFNEQSIIFSRLHERP